MILFVLSQTALLFILVSKSCNEDTVSRITTNCIYGLICIVLICFMSGIVRKTFLVLYQALCFVPNLVILGWYRINRSIIKSTDFWVIFDTNFNEANGFLSIVEASTFIWVAIYGVVSLTLCILAIIETSNETHLIKSIAAVILWLTISLFLPFRAHVPSVDFYKSFRNYEKERNNIAEFYASRQGLNVESSCYLPEGRKTFVIIIGESATRCHYSLYGYCRPTTPHLDAIREDIICYDNVIAPDIQTLSCLKQMLTFTNYEMPDMYKKEANIIEILRDAGYKTFWYDNQGIGGIDTYTPTSYRTIAQMCDSFHVNTQYVQDENLVDMLETTLEDTTSCKVIFIHLNGSHFPYKVRYPESFAYFSNHDICTPLAEKLNVRQTDVINEYDNSILYNDYILSECINLLRNESGLSALLYVSDHGEEVYDNQLYAGRSFERLSRSMCEIPCIFWRNRLYKEQVALHINPHVMYCTDDMIHSIMDITGTTYSLKDTTRSMFRYGFENKQILVQGRKYESITNND